MTLPRPHEVEQDELSPRRDAAPGRLDLNGLLQKLIVVDEPYLDIAGCRLQVPEEHDPNAMAERFRAALRDRFLKRRPHADDATWNTFASSLRAALSDDTKASEETLSKSLSLVDGL